MQLFLKETKLLYFVALCMGEDGFNTKYNKTYIDRQSILNVNVPEELEKLYDLKGKGIITEEEFIQRKRKLL